jgi:hypothetical protein
MGRRKGWLPMQCHRKLVASFAWSKQVLNVRFVVESGLAALDPVSPFRPFRACARDVKKARNVKQGRAMPSHWRFPTMNRMG